MSTTTESLERKIESAVERLMREHLAACESAAGAAVQAAFRRASRPVAKPGRRVEPSRSRSSSQRRSRVELAELEERLYQAICAHPGETMAVIAPIVGATPRALNRPATTLRRVGRVRSVGKRQATRYFPMDAS